MANHNYFVWHLYLMVEQLKTEPKNKILILISILYILNNMTPHL